MEQIIPVLNKEIIWEYRNVLMRDKFHLTEEIVEGMIQSLEEQGEYMNPEYSYIELPEPKDTIFYVVVMEKRKEEDAYLITGNIRHFPTEYYIVTPREMLLFLSFM